MVFGKLFRKRETLVGLDIGSSTIKLVELDLTADKPVLLNVGVARTPSDCISGNSISKPELVAEVVTSLFEENNIAEGRRISVAMPGSSVFTKRVKMPRMSLDELADNIQLEAGNFIPHNINAVKLDYHIIGESGKNQIDVLVVAVKEEVVESFLDTLSYAGLEAAVVDVDYFALQNIFELAAPERVAKTVALINVGARFSSINICSKGSSLFTGDVSIGGKLFTESIAEQLSMRPDEAEAIKRAPETAGDSVDQVREALEKNIEYVASEFNRQLSFFWGASGAEETIDRILIAGGGARVDGLVEEMSEKTGIVCEYLDPLSGIETPAGFDKAYIKEIGPVLGVAMGLALREPGDKMIPEFME